MNWRHSIVWGCALGLSWSSVYAQDAPETHVKTTAKADDQRMASGFTDRVSTESVFEEGTDLARALQFLPGIYIRRQGSFGQSAYATVRGSNARQVSVTLDGQRIQTPFGPGFDLGTFSAAGIDSIDVYRGGAAAFHGSGALSGSLNLRTATRDQPGWAMQASTLGGSWQTFGVSGHADLASQKTAGRLSGSWGQSDGAFPFVDGQGNPHERVNNDNESGSVLGTVAHKFGRDNRIKATVNYQQSDRGVAGPAEFQQTFESARLDESRVFGTIRAEEREVVEGRALVVDLYQTLGAQSRMLAYENQASILGNDTIANRGDFLSVSGGTGALFFFPLINNLTHLDVDVRGESYASKDETAQDQDLRADRVTLGATISNELLVFQDQVSLIAGGRVESLTGSFEDTGLMAGTGVVFRVLPALSLKANGARTFRAPDFDELYLDLESIRGNPDLQSEEAWVWDAGVTLEHQVLTASLSYFQNHVDTLIAFVPVSSYVIEATNLDGVLSQGVEAALSVPLFKRVLLSGGYTYTHSRAQELPQVQTPNQPEHRGFGRVEWLMMQNISGVHRLSINGQVSAQSTTNLDRFGNIQNPAYATIDSGLSYMPLSWAGLSLTAYNLTDRRDVVDGLQRPLPGRSFYASLTLKTGSP